MDLEITNLTESLKKHNPSCFKVNSPTFKHGKQVWKYIYDIKACSKVTEIDLGARHIDFTINGSGK